LNKKLIAIIIFLALVLGAIVIYKYRISSPRKCARIEESALNRVDLAPRAEIIRKNGEVYICAPEVGDWQSQFK
jgi:hypothetical protein